MAGSIHEIVDRDAVARSDVFSAGKYIGDTVGTVLANESKELQDRGARALAGISEVAIVPNCLAQGLWHGYGSETPKSLIKKDSA